MRKKNYLNNWDLMKEIHKSKISYCSFLTKDDSQHDVVIEHITDINTDVIAQAHKNQKKRVKKDGLDDTPITDQDLVFRVMSDDHMPLAPAKMLKKQRDKAEKLARAEGVFNELLDDDEQIIFEDHTRPPVRKVSLFPPFVHYRLDEQNQPYLVGKSHWKGGLYTGEFCDKHGQITNTLANMYIMLCKKLGSKGCYSGYSYNDEMQSQALMQLTASGLKFNEFKSENPFAYLTQIMTNSFSRVLNSEKKIRNIRDDMLEADGLKPSETRQRENLMTEKEKQDARDYYKFKKKEPKEKLSDEEKRAKKAAYAREYNRKNREKLNANQREYGRKNREKKKK